MLKFALVVRLAAAYPRLHRSAVEAIVATTLETMVEAHARGDRMEIRGFCTLSIKRMRARVGRNPRTSEGVAVAEKAAIHCAIGREMHRRLNPDSSPPRPQRGKRAAPGTKRL